MTDSKGRRPESVSTITGLSTRFNETTRGSGAVALVEFSDFQCPFSGRHARETLHAIAREFVDTGRVRYVFRDFPLEGVHRLAFKAAVAAECARRLGHYWETHDRLFADQENLDEKALASHAEALHLDSHRFSSCLAGSAAGKVKADIAEGKRLGVNATPTFFIGIVQPDGQIALTNKIAGAQPFTVFQRNLEHPSGLNAPRQ